MGGDNSARTRGLRRIDEKKKPGLPGEARPGFSESSASATAARGVADGVTPYADPMNAWKPIWFRHSLARTRAKTDIAQSILGDLPS
jgi:hypothetical protein